jgi:preprotein translocase subunit YajC
MMTLKIFKPKEKKHKKIMELKNNLQRCREIREKCKDK